MEHKLHPESASDPFLLDTKPDESLKTVEVPSGGIHTNDSGSVHQYFKFYSKLQNQQNMLMDEVRTNHYRNAILNNKQDFQGKIVMDVGAGSGILSLFAA